MSHVSAESISRTVHEQLQDPPCAGIVLAVFARAFIVAFPESRVVSIVHPDLSNGPLNIVLTAPAVSFHGIHEGVPAWIQDSRLCTEGLEITADEAVIWEPQPDWSRLRARRIAIVEQFPLLRNVALAEAPAGSLLSLLAEPEPHTDEANIPSRVSQVALRGALSLRAAWKGEMAKLGSAATRLAGLGPGLTPAGDDFLAGVMLRTWLVHDTPEPVCQLLLDAAAPQTSILSSAFLRAASRGECSDAWHQLFHALDKGSVQTIRRAVGQVLSFGDTSGADTLAGFLWLDSDSDSYEISDYGHETR